MNRSAFLTAEWRYLAMMSYEIEPDILLPYVPPGTELDSWKGKTFVSLVGFLFLKTKVFGFPIPFHQSFEEVNLRFYVRRKVKNEKNWRRGVVFIKEIVPKHTVAIVARAVYNEKYVAMPMRHKIDLYKPSDKPSDTNLLQKNGAVEYGWRYRGKWNHLSITTIGEAQATVAGSEEEFTTEHYWGYTIQRDGGSIEYGVEHLAWRVWQVSDFSLDCDVAEIYGSEFVDCLNSTPSSAFLAEGSPVIVRKGVNYCKPYGGSLKLQA